MSSRWTDNKNPSAFAGVSLFGKANPKYTQKQASSILSQIPTYPKFCEKKRPKIYNPYFVRKKRKIIQSDLLHMLHPPSMKKDNSGFVYILVVQDILPRKIWALPLKNKTGDTIIENLEKKY